MCVSDNGSCVRGETCQSAFATAPPRPMTAAPLARETAGFRDIYDRIQPHQSLGDRPVVVAGDAGEPAMPLTERQDEP